MAAPQVSPEMFVAMAREALASQPFSQLLGTRLNSVSPGQVELELDLTPQLLQQHGFAHGGVLSYLADNALTFAGGTAMQVPVVTSEYKVNYVRPGVGERLIARAKAEHVGASQAVCTCEVFAVTAGVEKLCALAQCTIARLPSKAEAA
ncbi:PaaI family thioesterase [Variovorax sp. HJSM1_2]|uniref:PaaI family thioesterase n=1 Tax=Variovorax sp. HJSM1_2 TaxID=3366263 RepID=UPI003BC8F1A6